METQSITMKINIGELQQPEEVHELSEDVTKALIGGAYAIFNSRYIANGPGYTVSGYGPWWNGWFGPSGGRLQSFGRFR